MPKPTRSILCPPGSFAPPPASQTDGLRERPEYALGRQCWMNGESHCPHAAGDARTAWWLGYFDARTSCRLRRVFGRLKIVYP
jgi:hypothetical protein